MSLMSVLTALSVAMAPPPALATAAPTHTAATQPAEPVEASRTASSTADDTPATAPAEDAAAATTAPDTAADPESGTGEEEDLVVTGRAPSPADPLAGINAQAFSVVQDADAAVVEPLAQGYRDALPSPVRRGIRNFLQNLREPIAILNSLLQLKIGRAFETLGRFAINTTVGIGGIIDVARAQPFNLPRRPNGFANTLGFYGVEPGAYLFLPLIGSTSVRDLIGGTIDGLLYPTIIGAPFTQLEVTIPVGSVSALDFRVENDEAIRRVMDNAADPYVATREAYLARRQAEIDALRGRTPPPPVGMPVSRAPSTPTPPAPPPVPPPAPAVTPDQ